MYFHYKLIADNDAPGEWPVWTPEAILAGFTKRSTIYCYTQNMKALGLVVSEKKIFNVFPIVRLSKLMTPEVGPFFYPIRRIYLKLHITVLHTKYKSFGSCGFREEDLFMCFPL